MPKEISEDLCQRVVYFYNDDFSITDITNMLYISKSFVNKIINLYESGHVLLIQLKEFLAEKSYLAEGMWGFCNRKIQNSKKI